MKKRMLALGLSAMMAVGMLAGCSGGNTAETTKAPEGTQAQQGEQGNQGGETTGEKVLNFGCQMYSDGMIDPAAQTNCAWNCMRYGISESLFKFDDSMVPQPWLAEKAETEDNITWVVTLKSGIKFSDGCDLTATKVKESFDRLMAEGPNGSSSPQKFVPYETVITADDAANTVTFVLPQANAAFMGNVSHPVCAITDVACTTDWTNGVIATGPYAVVSHVELTSYEMKKNEYYYEEVPYDKVNILFMGDASAKAMALQNGQVDLVENITNVSDIQSLDANPDFTVKIASGVRCGFAWMNQAEGRLLSNDTLRQAILMAIDYKTICESNTIGGLYTPGFSVLPSTLAYGYENLKNPYEYDPEGAAKLLDDAGIVDTDGDGIRELNGQNINLTFVSYENRLLNDFADAQTQYLAEIGIACTAKYGSSEDQWSSLVAGEYDFNQNNWTTVANGDPNEYMANWYGKAESNYCGYKNDEYDALYEEYATTFDSAKRAELLEKMQQILVNDAAVLVDGYYNSSFIYSKNVGYAQIHTADYYWISTEITPAN